MCRLRMNRHEDRSGNDLRKVARVRWLSRRHRHTNGDDREQCDKCRKQSLDQSIPLLGTASRLTRTPARAALSQAARPELSLNLAFVISRDAVSVRQRCCHNSFAGRFGHHKTITTLRSAPRPCRECSAVSEPALRRIERPAIGRMSVCRVTGSARPTGTRNRPDLPGRGRRRRFHGR